MFRHFNVIFTSRCELQFEFSNQPSRIILWLWFTTEETYQNISNKLKKIVLLFPNHCPCICCSRVRSVNLVRICNNWETAELCLLSHVTLASYVMYLLTQNNLMEFWLTATCAMLQCREYNLLDCFFFFNENQGRPGLLVLQILALCRKLFENKTKQVGCKLSPDMQYKLLSRSALNQEKFTYRIHDTGSIMVISIRSFQCRYI